MPNVVTPAVLGATSVRLLKMFMPETMREPLKVLVKETLLKVREPPEIVTLELDILIWDVPALKVRFVDVVKSIAGEPTIARVLEPSVMVLALVLLDVIPLAATLKFAVLNVPCVTVMAPADVTLSASPSVNVIPAPETLMPLNIRPAVVSVPVPMNDTTPIWLHTIPDVSVTEPATDMLAVPPIVRVKPVQLMLLAPVLPAAIVTVIGLPVLDAALKNTSSTTPGTLAPPGPPDVADHLVPAVPSHEPVPPTQNLSGIAVAHIFRWALDNKQPVIQPLLL
jgi:hypothetical protein